MFCTPKYGQPNRQEAESACSPQCFHYEACKKELGLKEDWKFPVWKEVQPTNSQLLKKIYHKTKQGDKRVWIYE